MKESLLLIGLIYRQKIGKENLSRKLGLLEETEDQMKNKMTYMYM